MSKPSILRNALARTGTWVRQERMATEMYTIVESVQKAGMKRTRMESMIFSAYVCC